MEPENTNAENEQLKPQTEEAEDTAATQADAAVAVDETDADHEPTLGEIGAEENAKLKAQAANPVKKPGKKVSLPLTIVIALVVAVVCGYAGFAASGAINASLHSTPATLSEDQLDTVVATYVVDGSTNNVTAREVIEGSGTAADSDGNYAAPSASSITSYVQNEVLMSEADKRGIEATDDEVAELAESQMGTSDYDSIGSSYGLSGEQVKQMFVTSVKTNKLASEVTGLDVDTPAEPEDPGKKKRSEKTEEFGSYVVDLLTKAGVWDSTSNTWTSTDNDYYSELGDDFDGTTASYTQAKKVYDLYSADYQSKMTQASTDWTNFSNELDGKVELTIYGVYSS